MKRTLAILLIPAMALSLCAGCQKTPESPIVIGKDNEQMIEKAGAAPTPELTENAARSTIRERYGFPADYEFHMEKGKLCIDVGAVVGVPDVPAMPMIRVVARDFTQDEVSRFYKLFCGDKTMYIPPERMTKAQIEERLVRVKKDAAQLAASGKEDDISTAAFYIDEEIPLLEELYASAPENNALVLADGTLARIEITEPNGNVIGSYFGLNAVENPAPGYSKEFGAQFRVANNDDMLGSAVYGENDRQLTGRAKRTGASMLYSAAAMKAFNMPDIPLPEDAAVRAGIAPEEARAIVESFLAENNLPFETSDISFVEGENYDMNGPLPPESSCYIIACRRVLAGVSCASLGTGSYVGEGAFAQSWDNETLSFYVDKNGIISMLWSSPLDIEDAVVADCALLPFAEIVSVFEKMMPISYEPLAKEGFMGSVAFDIERVSLELVRIIEQNSIEHGLLIPAWCFYGTRTALYSDGSIYDHHGSGYGCYLIVNAIDGSVIDAQKGY